MSSIYEKIVTGRNLNKIFSFDKLDDVENYLIHIESVNGNKNNYIMSMESDKVAINDFNVTSTNLNDLKLI